MKKHGIFYYMTIQIFYVDNGWFVIINLGGLGGGVGGLGGDGGCRKLPANKVYCNKIRLPCTFISV